MADRAAIEALLEKWQERLAYYESIKHYYDTSIAYDDRRVLNGRIDTFTAVIADLEALLKVETAVVESEG